MHKPEHSKALCGSPHEVRVKSVVGGQLLVCQFIFLILIYLILWLKGDNHRIR